MGRAPTGRHTWQARHGRLAILGVGRLGRQGAAFLCVVCVLALTLLGPLALRAAASGRAPGGDVASASVRDVDVASPAIVRIATIYEAHLTLRLCVGATTLPSSGAYAVGGLGSGAFVSASGVVLTADHVVDIQHADLVAGLLGDPRTAQDVASAVNAAHCPGVPTLSANDIANGALDVLGIPYTPSFSQPRYLVWQDTSYTGPLATSGPGDAGILEGLLSTTSYQATILAESPFDQDDLALLQVPLTDTPSIQLGNAQTLAPEDALTLIGFPGNADVTSDGESSNPNNLLTPSINNLAVSALKTNNDGALLIEVSGNVEHGDSGGPVLDSNGQLIGVVSYGGGDYPDGTSFLRSSTSAHTLLASAGTNTTPGAFERAWEQAFADYAATYTGHWHVAARELDALVAHYPAFQGAQPYQQYADAAARSEAAVQVGALRLSPAFLGGIVAVAALLALILVVVLVVALWRRAARRSQESRELQARQLVPALVGGNAGAAPAGYGAFGGYAPPSGYQPSATAGAYGASSGYSPYGGNGGYGGYGGYGSYGPTAPTGSPWGAGSPRPGAPGQPVAAADRDSASAAWGVCAQGHALAPGVILCDRCGSARRGAEFAPLSRP